MTLRSQFCASYASAKPAQESLDLKNQTALRAIAAIEKAITKQAELQTRSQESLNRLVASLTAIASGVSGNPSVASTLASGIIGPGAGAPTASKADGGSISAAASKDEGRIAQLERQVQALLQQQNRSSAADDESLYPPSAKRARIHPPASVTGSAVNPPQERRVQQRHRSQ
jgi:hypothetical protein